MPKSKNYDDYKNMERLNKRFVNKEIKTNEKEDEPEDKNHELKKQPKTEFTESPIYDSDGNIIKYVIHCGASKHARMYVDNITEIVDDKYYMERNISKVQEMYRLLCRDNCDEIICKQTAFKRMKEEYTCSNNATMYCTSNAKDIFVTQMKLNPYCKAYLMAIIFPSVFEVCMEDWFGTGDLKYSIALSMWTNMLEDAIIVDGIMCAINDFFINKLLPSNHKITLDSIGINREVKYDIEQFFKIESKSENYMKELENLYRPIITLSCHVDEKRIKDRGKKDRVKSATRVSDLIQYNFLQSGTKGNAMYGYLHTYTKECMDNYKAFEPTVKGALQKIFPLYVINKQSHLLDFYWHNTFNIDFHLTGGLITNYVLYRIMKQSKELYAIEIKKPLSINKCGVEYTTFSTYECLQNSIEAYDFNFINKLIKLVSRSILEYDLWTSKDMANNFITALKRKNVTYIIDYFIQFLNEDLESQQVEDAVSKSRAYYDKMYDDIFMKFESDSRIV